MKTLADGTQVDPRTFYYLLDFNDRDNWKFISTFFNKMKLSDLTKEEYWQLFEHVTKVDLETLKSI